jgi:hypothetical protein
MSTLKGNGWPKPVGRRAGKQVPFAHAQCDQIGRNFAIWAIFFGIGHIFSEKYRPNDLGATFS